MHLLKHALHNTCPDMMKSIGKDENGNDIKVRDSEGIQLANAKIDEIRNGFSEWLEEQSPQFKERLTTMYNRKFNCFVRPKYDGSHQTFPDLNLKGLASRGIKSVYPSQMDCVWMLKQNGGGICDHEVGTGKTLIMCIGDLWVGSNKGLFRRKAGSRTFDCEKNMDIKSVVEDRKGQIWIGTWESPPAAIPLNP